MAIRSQSSNNTHSIYESKGRDARLLFGVALGLDTSSDSSELVHRMNTRYREELWSWSAKGYEFNHLPQPVVDAISFKMERVVNPSKPEGLVRKSVDDLHKSGLTEGKVEAIVSELSLVEGDKWVQERRLPVLCSEALIRRIESGEIYETKAATIAQVDSTSFHARAASSVNHASMAGDASMKGEMPKVKSGADASHPARELFAMKAVADSVMRAGSGVVDSVTPSLGHSFDLAEEMTRTARSNPHL